MKTIVIENEFLHGPVWVIGENGVPDDEAPFLARDPVLAKLNEEAGEMFDDYYEFDSHDVACWFDTERQKAEKPKMLELITKIVERIKALDDGSFVLEDHETPWLKEP